MNGVQLCKACSGMDSGVFVRTVTVQSQSVVLGPRGMEVVDTDAASLRCPKCDSGLERIPTPYSGMGFGTAMTEYQCKSCGTRFTRHMGTMMGDDGSMYVSPALAKAMSEARAHQASRRPEKES
jgi:hypothetical protein